MGPKGQGTLKVKDRVEELSLIGLEAQTRV